MSNALKVIELRAENIMRLKAVQIRPSSNVVVIGGENEQGKSAIFNCIRMALGGAKATPEVPVRRGESEGHVFLDLGDISVELTLDASGRKVVVRNADGKKQATPQAILDRLYSRVAFNPLEFATKKPAEQQKILKELVGLDFTAADAQRATLYEKRTSVGQVRTDAEARIGTFPVACINAADEEVSVAALVAEKDAAEKKNRENQRVFDALEGARRVRENKEEALEFAKKALKGAQAIYDESVKAEDAADAATKALEPDFDVAPIVEKIKGAEDINRLVRAKKDRAKAVADFKKSDTDYERLTGDIANIDNEKTSAMKKAKWPIPGLGFSTDGVTFDALPFEQASKAQRMKVSVAIGAALHPNLNVLLLEDASLLDKSSIQVVYDVAEERDMQVWLEVVGDGGAGAVIIEDGEVAPDHSGDV